MKQNSPNSYKETVNIDNHSVVVLIIDTPYERSNHTAEVQSIDGQKCLSFYLKDKEGYENICEKAKAEASKKWNDFINA